MAALEGAGPGWREGSHGSVIVGISQDGESRSNMPLIKINKLIKKTLKWSHRKK